MNRPSVTTEENERNLWLKDGDAVQVKCLQVVRSNNVQRRSLCYERTSMNWSSVTTWRRKREEEEIFHEEGASLY